MPRRQAISPRHQSAGGGSAARALSDRLTDLPERWPGEATPRLANAITAARRSKAAESRQAPSHRLAGMARAIMRHWPGRLP